MIVHLNEMRPGERGIVVDILGGESARQKLVSMGLTPGATVQVLESYAIGPIIISASGVRFAVGRGLAGKVVVRKL